jgi:hypothetical protein
MRSQIEILFGSFIFVNRKPFCTPPAQCIMSVYEFAKASARRLRHEREGNPMSFSVELQNLEAIIMHHG